MHSFLVRASAVAMLLAVALPAPPARGCAFDDGTAPDLFGGSFEALHPQASVVYFAIVDALAQGVLDRSAFQPVEAGHAGYWRAVGRINDLHRRLSAFRAGHTPPPMSLLLIDSGLWSRLEPGPNGLVLSVHTSGAREDDAVIATSEASLSAVLDGRMTAAMALARGLIAIGGTGTVTVRMLIETSLSEAAASPPAAPVRLFGPAR